MQRKTLTTNYLLEDRLPLIILLLDRGWDCGIFHMQSELDLVSRFHTGGRLSPNESGEDRLVGMDRLDWKPSSTRNSIPPFARLTFFCPRHTKPSLMYPIRSSIQGRDRVGRKWVVSAWGHTENESHINSFKFHLHLQLQLQIHNLEPQSK